MTEAKQRNETSRAPALRTLKASDLLAGQREIIIQHQGVSYRLRVTRNEKLILCK